MRLLLALLVSAQAQAMVVDPIDPAFGFAVGPMTWAVSGAHPDVHRMAPLADGGVAVLASAASDAQGCIAVSLLVFDTDGHLARQFDRDGMALPRCFSGDPLGLAATSDAYYIAGAPAGESGGPRVFKVRADGAPDLAFGEAGSAPIPGVASFLGIHAEVLPDGTIAVGGTARVRAGVSLEYPALAVAHLRADGTAAAGFGTGGLAVAVAPTRPIHDKAGGGMAHLPDGSVLVAGNIFEDDAGAKIYTDATVVRFDPQGRLDPGYGTGGFALPLADASTYVQSLAVRNGEAYLAGIQNRDAPFAFVTRVTREGRLDLGFGDAGVAGTYDFQATGFDPRVAVDASGRVYLALVDRFQRKVLRYSAQGTRDAGFGASGEAYVVPEGWIYTGRGDLAVDVKDRVHFVAGANAGVAAGAPAATVAARLLADGGKRDGLGVGTAVVYYNAALDHYFLTANPAEQALLDTGTTKGWQRTGGTFPVVTSALAELTPVCRFYGRPEAHLDSHFFSASPVECDAVAARFGASWLLETAAAFYVHPADPVSGACLRGSLPVYRAFDNRADANHFYGVTPGAPPGWVYEGYGAAPLPTAFCAPLI